MLIFVCQLGVFFSVQKFDGVRKISPLLTGGTSTMQTINLIITTVTESDSTKQKQKTKQTKMKKVTQSHLDIVII